MKTYALVENSVVSNVILWDGTTTYEPPANMTAVEVLSGETVGVGYAYASGVFTAPAVPTPTLTEVQTTQIARINASAQIALGGIVAAYPDLEVATWPQQYAEAQAYTASSTASTPMLSAIATACNSTVSAMASSVMAKAAAYQSASGAAIGKRLLLTGEIQAATTVAAVQAIVW